MFVIDGLLESLVLAFHFHYLVVVEVNFFISESARIERFNLIVNVSRVETRLKASFSNLFFPFFLLLWKSCAEIFCADPTRVTAPCSFSATITFLQRCWYCSLMGEGRAWIRDAKIELALVSRIRCLLQSTFSSVSTFSMQGEGNVRDWFSWYS